MICKYLTKIHTNKLENICKYIYNLKKVKQIQVMKNKSIKEAQRQMEILHENQKWVVDEWLNIINDFDALMMFDRNTNSPKGCKIPEYLMIGIEQKEANKKSILTSIDTNLEWIESLKNNYIELRKRVEKIE